MSFTAGSSGGKYKETLTIDQMPKHRHTIETSMYTGQNTPGGSNIQGDGHANIGRWPYEWATYTGGNQAHNNTQPYVVVCYWRRTA